MHCNINGIDMGIMREIYVRAYNLTYQKQGKRDKY